MSEERISLAELDSPCYLFDERALHANAARAAAVQDAAGCRILLALKSFAVWRLFPYFADILAGVTASSLSEAKLGGEHFGGELHVYAPAYREQEFAELAGLASHIVFNSEAQWRHFRAAAAGQQCGIRVNPGYSEVTMPLYNPCLPKSQFGIPAESAAFLRDADAAAGISGVHFHALCEQNADSLQRVVAHFEQAFGDILAGLEWVNMGGGHLLADDDYQTELLISVITGFKRRYGVEVYLEPGGGLVSNCCSLLTTVLDITPEGVVLLDASASAHIPDVIETPYRPHIIPVANGADNGGEAAHHYRLCGSTCMAGDIFGDYHFSRPLRVGDRLWITDAAAYTIVKNTTFNGVGLPAIALQKSNGDVRVLRRFSYEDYRARLS